MAQDLNTFTVRLEFNEEGKVAAITYEDLIGCGKTIELPGQLSLEGLVNLHLQHYSEGHDVRPRVRCPYLVRTEPFAVDFEPRTLRCTLDVHADGTKHHFEMVD